MTRDQKAQALRYTLRSCVQGLSDNLCWARGAPAKRDAAWRAEVRADIATIRLIRAELSRCGL